MRSMIDAAKHLRARDLTFVRDRAHRRDGGLPLVIADAGNRRGKVHQAGGHHPRHIAIVVRRARLRTSAERRRRRAQPEDRLLRRLLEILGELLLLLAPCRHADHLDILLHALGDRLAHELRPRRGRVFDVPGRAGHQRGAFGDLQELVVGFLRGRHAGVAHEPPDLSLVGDDVGLDAAGGDGAMRPVGRAQVLAQLVEADIHQLDRVDRILAVPRIDRAVGGLAMKGEDRADRGIVLQRRSRWSACRGYGGR